MKLIRILIYFLMILTISASAAGLAAPGIHAAPPEVTATRLPAGCVGQAYNLNSIPLSLGGGTAPFTWSVIEGNLPDGLTLDPVTGTIAGTPEKKGKFDFTMQVTDSTGVLDTQPFSITITPGAGGPDAFGYTFRDSHLTGGPAYEWIEIRESGTKVLPDSDDSHIEDIDIGFEFNYYGTYFNRISVTGSGLAFSAADTGINGPITGTDSIHGFIAPYWDDLRTESPEGAVYYQSLGTAPERKFVIEWHDYYSAGSSSGITFELVLYEESNNILFQYQDVDSGDSNYDGGRSATVGIESPDGTDGLQYLYDEALITGEQAIMFYYPPFEGPDLYLSQTAPDSLDRGSEMTCTFFYVNFGDVPAANVVLTEILPAEVVFIAAPAVIDKDTREVIVTAGTYDKTTHTVTWNIGEVPAYPDGRGYTTVTVLIREGAEPGAILTSRASINTSQPETGYEDNEASASTRVMLPSLPPNTSIDGITGYTGQTPCIHWNNPVVFKYTNPDAESVDIHINIDDDGTDDEPDYSLRMTGPAPDWNCSITFFPRYGNASVTIIPHFQESAGQEVSFNLFIDPAGYTYDLNSGARIEGAMVWLQRPDGRGGWENVPIADPPGAPIILPNENPLTTGPGGQYHWDTPAGIYRVHAEAAGYYPADSLLITVPPPVTDLHIGLTPELKITTESLPPIRTDINCDLDLEAAGGTGIYSWSLSAGDLPAGITLHGDGSLTGTASAPGVFNFTVQVGSGPFTVNRSFSITVNTAGNASWGGGGTFYSVVNTGVLTSSAPLLVDHNGYVQGYLQLHTPDGQARLQIPAGSRLRNARGGALNSLSIDPLTTPLAVPPGSAVILVYNFTPDGAVFTPPLNLVMQYDPDKLPEGVKPADLYIAVFKDAEWVTLASAVDETAATVTAPVPGFSTYALLGKVTESPSPSPSPSDTPSPAPDITPTGSPSPSPAPSSPAATPPASPTPDTTPLPEIPDPGLAEGEPPDASSPIPPSPGTAPPSAPFGWPMAAGVGIILVLVGLIVIVIRRNSKYG